MWVNRPNSSTLPSALNTSDPDELFQCPYDPYHRIRASRFSHHLKKCGKIHGDIVLLRCPYNGSHLIKEENYEEHVNNCVDRVAISQDIEAEMGLVPQLPKPNIRSREITSEEDWGEEADQIVQEQEEYEDYYEDDTLYYDNDGEGEEQTIPESISLQEETFNEPLLEEKPSNWESMSAAQKKNYKRKYKRQQERLKASGFAPVEKSKNPEDWTDEERKHRLDAILAKYPLVGKANDLFTDYKSLLNQICQKLRINQPMYRGAVADSQFGGFGAECIIKSEAYRSHGYERTKQAAEHNAAKWALLSIDIPLDGDTDGRLPNNLAMMREKDEIRRLELERLKQQQVKRLRQPVMAPSAPKTSVAKPEMSQASEGPAPPSSDNRTSEKLKDINDALGNLKFKDNSSSEVNTPCDNSQDEWQTVSSKKSAGVQGAGVTKTRGRGRGRGNWSSS